MATHPVDFARPIHLVPLPACADRPTLTIESDSAILFLGDNDSTGIVDPALSHKVVKVYIKRQKIFAFCLPDGRGNAKLNGVSIGQGNRRQLHIGDVLSLQRGGGGDKEGEDDDELDGYEYRVEQSQGSASAAAAASVSSAVSVADAAPAAAVATTASSTTTISDAAGIQKEVGEETICAVCMEIMVNPRTIVPCGHSFCADPCIATQAGSCAECRGPIQSQVTCRSLQNLIERLVDTSDKQNVPIFEKDDIESYRIRTGSRKTSAVASTSRKRRCISRDGASSGEMAADLFGGVEPVDLTG